MRSCISQVLVLSNTTPKDEFNPTALPAETERGPLFATLSPDPVDPGGSPQTGQSAPPACAEPVLLGTHGCIAEAAPGRMTVFKTPQPVRHSDCATDCCDMFGADGCAAIEFTAQCFLFDEKVSASIVPGTDDTAHHMAAELCVPRRAGTRQESPISFYMSSDDAFTPHFGACEDETGNKVEGSAAETRSDFTSPEACQAYCAGTSWCHAYEWQVTKCAMIRGSDVQAATSGPPAQCFVVGATESIHPVSACNNKRFVAFPGGEEHTTCRAIDPASNNFGGYSVAMPPPASFEECTQTCCALTHGACTGVEWAIRGECLLFNSTMAASITHAGGVHSLQVVCYKKGADGVYTLVVDDTTGRYSGQCLGDAELGEYSGSTVDALAFANLLGPLSLSECEQACDAEPACGAYEHFGPTCEMHAVPVSGYGFSPNGLRNKACYAAVV